MKNKRQNSLAEIVDSPFLADQAFYTEGRFIMRPQRDGRVLMAGVVLDDMTIKRKKGQKDKKDELWLCRIKIVPLAKFQEPLNNGLSIDRVLVDDGLEPRAWKQCLLWPEGTEKPEDYP